MSQLLIKSVSGKTSVVDANFSKTIRALKDAVASLEGGDPDNLVLVWHSKVLSKLPDDVSLLDVGLRDLDVIETSFKLKSGPSKWNPIDDHHAGTVLVEWIPFHPPEQPTEKLTTEVPQTISFEGLCDIAAQVIGVTPRAFELFDACGVKIRDTQSLREATASIIRYRPFLVEVAVMTKGSERSWKISGLDPNFMNTSIMEITKDDSYQTPVAEWRLYEVDRDVKPEAKSTLTHQMSSLLMREIRTHHWSLGKVFDLNWDTRVEELFPPPSRNRTANKFRVEIYLSDFEVTLLGPSENDEKLPELDEDEPVVLAQTFGCMQIHGDARLSEWLGFTVRPWFCDELDLMFEDSPFSMNPASQFKDIWSTYSERPTFSMKISLRYRSFGSVAFTQSNCSICLEEMRVAAQEIGVLSCRHIFHWDCIDAQANHQNSCPQCRHRFSRIQRRGWDETGHPRISCPETVARRSLDIDSVATVWCLVCGRNMNVNDEDAITCFRCRASQHVACVNTDMRVVQCSTCALAIHGQCLADMNMFHDAVIFEGSWQCWRCNGTGGDEYGDEVDDEFGYEDDDEF